MMKGKNKLYLKTLWFFWNIFEAITCIPVVVPIIVFLSPVIVVDIFMMIYSFFLGKKAENWRNRWLDCRPIWWVDYEDKYFNVIFDATTIVFFPFYIFTIFCSEQAKKIQYKLNEKKRLLDTFLN